MNEPLVSIILPVLNVDKKFEICLLSILAQSYTNYELIVIDDSGSLNVNFESYLSKISISNYLYLKNSENLGAGKSRINGINRAAGEYIAFIDSDDCWAPEKLRIQIDAMRSVGANVSAHIYLQKIYIDILIDSELKIIKKYSARLMLFKSLASTPTIVCKRSFIKYYLPLKRCDDIAFLYLNMCYFNTHLYFIELPLAFGFKFAGGESGLTKSYIEMHKSVVNTYLQIINGNYPNSKKLDLIAAIIFEYIKFPFRIIIGTFRNLIYSI